MVSRTARISDRTAQQSTTHAGLRRGKRSNWAHRLGLPLAYVMYWPALKVLERLGKWPAIMSKVMDRAAGTFASYEPTARDVLVCSYFKSGSNWALQMAVQIAHRGQARFEHIHDLVPWAEIPDRYRIAVPLTDVRAAESAPTGLRVIKTHLPLSKVPYSSAARYVCVVRDPKDVFVSSYHFVRDTMLGPFMPSKNQWLDMFLSRDALFGCWAEHLRGFWAIRDRPNVLFITFEEMLRDSTAVARKMAALMGVELSPEELQAVLKQTSFAYLKSVGHRFETAGFRPFWLAEKSAMFRRGGSGTSGELLSHEEQRRIDEYSRTELERLDCDFPYASAFQASRPDTAAQVLQPKSAGIGR